MHLVEKELRGEIYDLKSKNQRLSDECAEVKEQWNKYQRDRLAQEERNEEQTQVRIHIEKNLNNLHAFNRSVESKYERACQEIHDLTIDAARLHAGLKQSKLEQVELNALKLSNNSKIFEFETHVEYLDQQARVHEEAAAHNDSRAVRLQTTVEELNEQTMV